MSAKALGPDLTSCAVRWRSRRDDAAVQGFAARLLAWFDQHGRKDLPWHRPRTPYRTWLSEIMLQQTQVTTVVPYFERFVRELPDIARLAAASPERVLKLWEGLGYYSRARNLHAAAQACVARHGGVLPADVASLAALPGIGRSTAAAIAAQAFGARHAILDGNVKRVLARHRGVHGDPSRAATQARLWSISESLLPVERLADYTQAQMDVGAMVCRHRQPRCGECPVADDCHAKRHDLQHELPERRPRRAAPEREVLLLLATDDHDRVLCETRPPHGIWGGLVSVPEFPDRAAFEREHRRLSLAPAVALPRFTHAFTHFRLNAQPYAAHSADAGAIGDNTRRWISRKELDKLALPTPIRRMLVTYWDSRRCPERSTAHD